MAEPKNWEDMNETERLESLRDDIRQLQGILDSFGGRVETLAHRIEGVSKHAKEVGDAVKEIEKKMGG